MYFLTSSKKIDSNQYPEKVLFVDHEEYCIEEGMYKNYVYMYVG